MKKNKQILSIISIFAIFFALMSFLCGCSKKSAIVGTWVTDDGGQHFVEMTFNSDGSFQGEYVLIMMSGSKSSHTWHGTWEVTDQNILNIDCGNKHFTSYWTDEANLEADDTWNISNGQLTYDGKTFHK